MSGPSGPSYIYQWDSTADLGIVRLDTVRIRITPFDLVVGTADETADFTVDNTPNQPVFTMGPSMVQGRIRHTATLLASGFVLIAGGTDSTNTVLQTAEVFDPIGNTFLLVPTPMVEPRAKHSAVRMPDDRVLIAGGVDASFFEHTSAEVFDPVTGDFQAVGSMPDFRANHTATSSSTGVYILGGDFLSGFVPVHYDDGLEFDPLSDLFISPALGPLVEKRSEHRAHELSNGRILLVGGGEGTNLSVEEFDPVTGMGIQLSISAGGDQAIGHDSALLQDGTVLILGGLAGRELISINWAYDQAFVYDATGPVGSRFTDVGPMNHSRRWHSATIMNGGRVAIVGGEDINFNLVGEASLYDPAVPTFLTADLMIFPRYRHVSVLLQDGRILITGGTADGTNVISVAEFFGL